MNKFLPLAFLFVSIPPFAIASGTLEVDVAASDAAGTHTWREAVAICEKDDMVLPSVDEAAAMFCHADVAGKVVGSRYPDVDKGCRRNGVSNTFGNFEEKGHYWTATEFSDRIARYVDLLDGALGYSNKEERLKVRCVDPKRGDGSRRVHAIIPFDINDIDRDSFNYIIDTIAAIYRDVFRELGKHLVINKRWEANEENAISLYMEEFDRDRNRINQIREIELVGGLARNPMLDRDAYAMIVCHEIGHHIGGAPHALGYSAEGQSDYFAAAKCMKRYLKVTRYENGTPDSMPRLLKDRCRRSFDNEADREVCERNILAGLKLARWIAHTREADPPDLAKRDGRSRRLTLVHGYPAPQCRLDTFVAGALCPVDEVQLISPNDARTGACTRAAGYGPEARPSCWFNERRPG